MRPSGHFEEEKCRAVECKKVLRKDPQDNGQHPLVGDHGADQVCVDSKT